MGAVTTLRPACAKHREDVDETCIDCAELADLDEESYGDGAVLYEDTDEDFAREWERA